MPFASGILGNNDLALSSDAILAIIPKACISNIHLNVWEFEELSILQPSSKYYRQIEQVFELCLQMSVNFFQSASAFYFSVAFGVICGYLSTTVRINMHNVLPPNRQRQYIQKEPQGKVLQNKNSQQMFASDIFSPEEKNTHKSQSPT